MTLLSVIVVGLVHAVSIGCANPGKPSASRPPAVTSTPSASRTAGSCEAFRSSVDAFGKTLVRPADTPPRIDPEKSPAAAAVMVRRAGECLAERGVRFRSRSELVLEIESTGATMPSDLASSVRRETGGTVVYDGGFFLAKPYAAAAFDKVENRLSLPHSAIWGDPAKASRHELRHVRSLALLRERPRVRHLLITNADTKPDALSVDEVFAYAAGAADSTATADERAWSRTMAEQYIAFARRALEDRTSTFRIETTTSSCPSDEALSAQVRKVLDCVNDHLALRRDVDACDEPPLSFPSRDGSAH